MLKICIKFNDFCRRQKNRSQRHQMTRFSSENTLDEVKNLKWNKKSVLIARNYSTANFENDKKHTKNRKPRVPQFMYGLKKFLNKHQKNKSSFDPKAMREKSKLLQLNRQSMATHSKSTQDDECDTPPVDSDSPLPNIERFERNRSRTSHAFSQQNTAYKSKNKNDIKNLRERREKNMSTFMYVSKRISIDLSSWRNESSESTPNLVKHSKEWKTFNSKKNTQSVVWEEESNIDEFDEDCRSLSRYNSSIDFTKLSFELKKRSTKRLPIFQDLQPFRKQCIDMDIKNISIKIDNWKEKINDLLLKIIEQDQQNCSLREELTLLSMKFLEFSS